MDFTSRGTDAAAAPRTTVGRRRRACERCKKRKQRCDYAKPKCGNCTVSGSQCTKQAPESLEQTPIRDARPPQRPPSGLEDAHTISFPSVGAGSSQLPHVQVPLVHQRQTSKTFPHMSWGQSPLPLVPVFDANGNDISWPNLGTSLHSYNVGVELGQQYQYRTASSSPAGPYADLQYPQHNVNSDGGSADLTTATTASCFKTYFQSIHPQYPFLNVKDCGIWYKEWTTASTQVPLRGWPAYFVKMVVAIGSHVQTKASEMSELQQQQLRAQTQMEQSVVTDTITTPLIQLQAMLLLGMLALHSDSTSRIAHISGAIMRFATMHDFHVMIDDGTEESTMKIKAWSCAYSIDRLVSGILDVPMTLSDKYITAKLYEETPEPHYPSPWLVDCPSSESVELLPNLGGFAHLCTLRFIQSKMLDKVHSMGIEQSSPAVWQEELRAEVLQWAALNGSFLQNQMFVQGYHSILWLQNFSDLSMLILCRPTRRNVASWIGDVVLEASCNSCSIIRTLQKQRSIAQRWLTVVSQFQAGITLYYVLWARDSHMSHEVNSAVRDCSAVLAIFADRWRNAECYRDCFELVARAESRRSMSLMSDGVQRWQFSAEERQEVTAMMERLVRIGVHRQVVRMLKDMCEGQ